MAFVAFNFSQDVFYSVSYVLRTKKRFLMQILDTEEKISLTFQFTDNKIVTTFRLQTNN